MLGYAIGMTFKWIGEANTSDINTVLGLDSWRYPFIIQLVCLVPISTLLFIIHPSQLDPKSILPSQLNSQATTALNSALPSPHLDSATHANAITAAVGEEEEDEEEDSFDDISIDETVSIMNSSRRSSLNINIQPQDTIVANIVNVVRRESSTTSTVITLCICILFFC